MNRREALRLIGAFAVAGPVAASATEFVVDDPTTIVVDPLPPDSMLHVARTGEIMRITGFNDLTGEVTVERGCNASSVSALEDNDVLAVIA